MQAFKPRPMVICAYQIYLFLSELIGYFDGTLLDHYTCMHHETNRQIRGLRPTARYITLDDGTLYMENIECRCAKKEFFYVQKCVKYAEDEKPTSEMASLKFSTNHFFSKFLITQTIGQFKQISTIPFQLHYK